MRDANKKAKWMRENRYRYQSDKLRRLEFIREYKNIPCADCGKEFPHYIMEFDHVRGDKIFNLSEAQRFTWNQLIEELGKCDVVCANCHKARTWVRLVDTLVSRETDL